MSQLFKQSANKSFNHSIILTGIKLINKIANESVLTCILYFFLPVAYLKIRDPVSDFCNFFVVFCAYFYCSQACMDGRRPPLGILSLSLMSQVGQLAMGLLHINWWPMSAYFVKLQAYVTLYELCYASSVVYSVLIQRLRLSSDQLYSVWL